MTTEKKNNNFTLNINYLLLYLPAKIISVRWLRAPALSRSFLRSSYIGVLVLSRSYLRSIYMPGVLALSRSYLCYSWGTSVFSLALML